jgi:hypothetical protein
MHFPRRTNFSVGGSNNSCSDHLIETLEERDLQKGSQIVLQRLSKMTEKTLRARFSALKDLFEKSPHSVTNTKLIHDKSD